MIAVAAAAAITSAACRGRDAAAAERGAARSETATIGATRAPGYVVDSALPPEEALRRFREGLVAPVRLDRDAAASRDQLVARFAAAVARQDTAALRRMSIGKAEFAYLYYPHTQYVRAPYLLAPDVVWQLMQSRSRSGMNRVVTRVGGVGLQLEGYACEAAPAGDGDIRLYQQCMMRYRRNAAATLEHRRLFGSIIERGGRYKFVSYANDF